MVEKHKPQIFKSDRLSKVGSHIKHGFFGRGGGVSKGIYQSLNVGVGSNDDQVLVKQNRALVAESLGVPSDHLVTVHQVHSKIAVSISDPWDANAWDNNRPKADAIVTNIENLAIGALTADCGPVLFADGNANVIAAAHAGWRGAFGGILESTIEAMEKLGSQRENIIATLGPCISQESYEVGAEFYETFIKENKTNAQHFIPSKKEKFHQFDLKTYIVQRLINAGIQADAMPQCTYKQMDDFFSYRKTTHNNEADYGRQISCIAINSI
jgi:YfiH family protein